MSSNFDSPDCEYVAVRYTASSPTGLAFKHPSGEAGFLAGAVKHLVQTRGHNCLNGRIALVPSLTLAEAIEHRLP